MIGEKTASLPVTGKEAFPFYCTNVLLLYDDLQPLLRLWLNNLGC